MAAAALVAVVANGHGWYIADARFEQYWASRQFLVRHRSIWDSARGFGGPAPYFSPAVGALVATFRALGAAPWLAERLTHATYLTVAGLGTVRLMRLWRPRLGAEHLLAGLFYMFNPFTTQFLVPSGLFLHYALVPWLLLAFLRGMRSRDPWRWAAGFAVAVFSVGALNPASIVYAAVPLVPAAVYLVAVERAARWRDVFAWLAKAATLTVAVCAAALVSLTINAGGILDNLATTELPSAVSRQSSWTESWRGLGSWLTYFRSGSALLHTESSGYFTHWYTVLATFAAPAAALIVLWRSTWRPRLLLVGMGVVALVLMVGLYPVTDPSPLGHVEDVVFRHLLALRSFRDGYKAGGGLTLAVGVLLAVALAQARQSAARFGAARLGGAWLSTAAVAVVLVLVAAAAYPFWTGHLYSRTDRVKSVPGYWLDAFRWLDGQPGPGRVLVLPGSTRTRYRWGYVGDDILDAFLHRPHVVRQSLPRTTHDAASVLAALDERATGASYVPGTIGAIARQLGVGWVLIRNDMAWEATSTPRPSGLAAVRRDPDLVPAATFGRLGENVSAPGDAAAGLLGENALPPVEVYAVRRALPPVQALPAQPPVLVAGDGDAWVSLAASGALSGTGPVLFSGDLSPAEVRRTLALGAALAVTDTNRRRVTQITTGRDFRSHTLADGENLNRPAQNLFGNPRTQSVASFGDGARITASRYGPLLTPFETSSRPANAFDGDPDTAWLVGGPGVVGEWVRATFTTPRVVSEVDLTPAVIPGVTSRITQASVRMSTGPAVKVSLAGPTSVATFPPRRTSFVEVRIDKAQGAGAGEVGFSEITVPGTELTEEIRVPDDVFRAELTQRGISPAPALTRGPVTYLFDRVISNGPQDEELAVRRRFETAASRSFVVQGTLSVGSSTPDRALDALVDGPSGAFGSDRSGPGGAGRGALAFDGDFGTGWEAPPLTGEQLTVRFPARLVDHVDVYPVRRGTSGDATAISPITHLRVTVGDPANGVSAEVSIPADAPCVDVAGARPGDCVEHATMAVPPTPATSVGIEVTGVDVVGAALGPRPLRVAEVSVDGPPAQSPVALDLSACHSLLRVDGAEVPVRIQGTLAAILSGERVPFTGCEPLELSGGTHSLETTPAANGMVDQIRLTAGAPAPAPAAVVVPQVRVVGHTATSLHAVVDAPRGAYLISGQAFAPGWGAKVNGHSLGRPIPLDGATAWLLPAGRRLDVVVRYGPQRTYELATAVSGGALAVCLWLLVRGRRRGGAP